MLLVRAGVLCNNALLELKEGNWQVIGDPTEGALIVLGKKAGISKEEFGLPIAEIPFSSERKLMTTVFKRGEKIVAYSKGAVEKVLQVSSLIQKGEKVEKLSEKERTEIIRCAEEMASSGLRVIALAYKICDKFSMPDSERDFIFLGLVGMIDPPRPEVKEAVEKCKQAGIKPIMITGDHKLTALAVAKEVGIIEKNYAEILTGEELDKMSDEELEQKVENISVYARVSPQHKVRILRALKKKGHVVAMTGDGVNDAPALKKADIGIAMGIKGTDVAKEASDMILADDNFATIVNAVEEGRGIYDNIRKFVRFLLSANFSEIVLIAITLLLSFPLPLLPLQILWINLITDGLPALALSVDPFEKDLLKRRPRDPKKGILDGMLLFILVATLLNFAVEFSIFMWSMKNIGNVEKARTMVFTCIVFYELFLVFNCRSEKHSVFRKGILENRKLLFAVFLSVILQLSVIYLPFFQAIFSTTPLNLSELLLVTAASASALFVLPEIFMGRGLNLKKLPE
jgi:Ca2+-transporting ATPase